MTSEEHADAVELLVRRLRSRVMGPGDEQYSGGGVQRFESRPVGVIAEDALEEVEDLIVYGVQLWLRLGGLARRLDALG